MNKTNRKFYLDFISNLAATHKLKVHIIGLWVATDLNTSYYFNQIRCQKRERDLIPKVAYYAMRKKSTEPSLEEGFTAIYKVRSGFLGGRWMFNLD